MESKAIRSVAGGREGSQAAAEAGGGYRDARAGAKAVEERLDAQVVEKAMEARRDAQEAAKTAEERLAELIGRKQAELAAKIAKPKDPFVRAESEDDDGYDPYSDRRPQAEPLFERDPWS